MRLLRVATSAAAALLLPWAAQAQVKSLQPDLKYQTVWDNVWGIVQVVFLPGGKVLTVHKPGELHVYDSILSKSQDYRTILDIKDEVYSWWDHGLLSAALHPEFPQQPYLYIAYSAEYPGKPWNDNCEVDPKLSKMSSPPDTRPYCKSMAKILRLKVDEDFTQAEVDAELFHDWCTSTYTHHIGTINFLADGSMVYGAGDGSHFQGIDHGQPQDECTDPKGPKDQGVFTSQKDEYLRGKFIKITKEAILKNDHLEKGVDYEFISKGARNPFRSTVSPFNGDVYFGDVGSSVWEEINRIPNPLNNQGQVVNFGWPCIEGVNSVSDIFQNFLKMNRLDTCKAVYQGASQKPAFVYRFGAIDPDFPDECADADASISGISFYTGAKLPEKYKGKLFWVDYSKKCGFWFDQGDDGLPNFKRAHAFFSTVGAGAGGVTDVKTGPDGYLYVVDYSGGKLYRFGDLKDKEMDELLTKRPATANGEEENDLWIASTPNPYEWAFGDTVTYALESPTVKIDEAKVTWRIVNGHCVMNPCTGNQDCHFHEISLNEEQANGPKGQFKPSPHPMESYIKITATAPKADGSGDLKKEFITHTIAYNYKIVSDPPGLPIIFEEVTCQQSPCILAQMAQTNPGFAAQVVQAFNDQVYVFDSWTATNAGTGKSHVVKTNLYEDVADADYTVKAQYKPLKIENDATILAPTDVTAEGEFKRIMVTWTAPEGSEPDYVIVNVKKGKTVVKNMMVTANKATVDVIMPPANEKYDVDVSFFDSTTNKRGARSAPIAVATKDHASKEKKNCVYDPFELKMKKSSKPGLGDKFQLAIVGDYPTSIRPKQTVKLTFDVVSDSASYLMVNILSKNDFVWAGGATVPVKKGQNGLMTVNFALEGDIENKKEYYIDALLTKDAKDYKTAFVEDQVSKIYGSIKPKPAPTPEEAAAAAAAEAEAAAAATEAGMPKPPATPAAGAGAAAAPATGAGAGAAAPAVPAPGAPDSAAPDAGAGAGADADAGAAAPAGPGAGIQIPKPGDLPDFDPAQAVQAAAGILSGRLGFHQMEEAEIDPRLGPIGV